MLVIGNIGREPVLQTAAVKRWCCFIRAEEILRCVASAAMARSFDQVGATIPFIAFVGSGCKGPGLEEQLIPATHKNSMVERPLELVFRTWVRNGLQSIEIGADCQNVVVLHFGEVGVRKRRIEPVSYT